MVAEPDFARTSCEMYEGDSAGDFGPEDECLVEDLSGFETSLKLYKEEGFTAAYSGLGRCFSGSLVTRTNQIACFTSNFQGLLQRIFIVQAMATLPG